MPARTPRVPRTLQSTLKTIGEKLRKRRKFLKVSAIDTAESASMSRMTLYRIERGDPSVTVGAYLSICSALGLELQIVDPDLKSPITVRLPEKIRLADYPELRRLAWQIKKTSLLTPVEAAQIYERNWRHIDIENLGEMERELIRQLALAFAKDGLLV